MSQGPRFPLLCRPPCPHNRIWLPLGLGLGLGLRLGLGLGLGLGLRSGLELR